MEKLSSILPSNARVKSVDLDDAHPVRPGVPSLGRPVGSTSSQRDRVTLSTQAKEVAFNETLAKKNPRDDQGVRIAAQLTDKFFNNRLGSKAENDFAPTLSEEVAAAANEIQMIQQNHSPTQKTTPEKTLTEQNAGVSVQSIDKYA